LRLDDIAARGKLIDLNAIKSDYYLFVFTQSHLVGSGPGFAALANAFANIEGHASRCSFHLSSKVTFATRKLRHDLTHLSIELQRASIFIELV
jgi:hypothetical protein